MRRLGPGFALAALVVALLLPVIGLNMFWQGQVVLMVTYALVVAGVNLSFGYAGELALGQVAIFATGAYVGGWLALHGQHELVVIVFGAIAAGIVVGLLSGLPGLRIGGWALAMTSFFLVVLIPDLTQLIPGIGGSVGLSGIPSPTIFGHALTNTQIYIASLILLALSTALFRNLVLSRHGIALKVLRESKELTAAVGTSVYRLKLLAYLGAAIPSALGGAIYSMQERFIGPSVFNFSLAVGVIAGSVIGGSSSIYGALVGGAILEYVNFRSASFTRYSLVVYGAVLLIGGVLISGGLAEVGRSALVRSTQRRPARGLPRADAESPGPGSLARALASASLQARPLAVHGIKKSFGAVAALDGVSLTAQPGQITALIGPNGSGKTTLLNVIAGVYRPDAGTVEVGGVPLDIRSAHLSAHAGISRTFQTPIIPSGLTAREVIASARYQEPYCSVGRSVFTTPAARRVEREDWAVSLAILGELGLGEVADEPATELSLGHRRLLEVGRALARRSSVILLDEAASGLDEGDIEVLVRTLRELRASGATVVLVEHNFPLVVELADVIHVLDLGTLIASGPPAVVKDDPVVIRSYLGDSTRRPQAGPPSGRGRANQSDAATSAVSDAAERPS